MREKVLYKLTCTCTALVHTHTHPSRVSGHKLLIVGKSGALLGLDAVDACSGKVAVVAGGGLYGVLGRDTADIRAAAAERQVNESLVLVAAAPARL